VKKEIIKPAPKIVSPDVVAFGPLRVDSLGGHVGPAAGVASLGDGVDQLKRRASVARWFIFIPKNPIRVNFGGTWNGKWSFVIFTDINGHFVNFMIIWYIFQFSVRFTTKNLATRDEQQTEILDLGLMLYIRLL
jgi:hypothetical protein